MIMIKLIRSPIPSALSLNGDRWAQEYAALREGQPGIPANASVRYRDPEIKRTVRADAHDKCVYCESKVSHAQPGDIEHIFPKSKRPDLVVDWTNLAYVCTECNRLKGDYYDPAEPLINPFEDDPGEHLRFIGALVFARPGDSLGIRTVLRLKLSRGALVERKQERLDYLGHLLHLWAQQSEGATKDALWEQIREEQQDDKEFAATVRSFLRLQVGE